MPITFRNDGSPLAQAANSFLAGYGAGRMKQAEFLQQQRLQQENNAAAAGRLVMGQALGTLSNVATQQLDYNNRVNLANLAHTRAMDMLPVRAQAAANEWSMKTYGMPYTGMQVGDQFIPGMVETAQQRGMSVPDFANEIYAQRLQTQFDAKLQAEGKELRYSSENQARVNMLEGDIAGLYSNPTMFNNGQWTPEGSAAYQGLRQQIDSIPKQVLPKQQMTGQEVFQQNAVRGPDGQVIGYVQPGTSRWTDLRPKGADDGGDQVLSGMGIQAKGGVYYNEQGQPLVNPNGRPMTRGQILTEMNTGVLPNGAVVTWDEKGTARAVPPPKQEEVAQPGGIDPKTDAAYRKAAAGYGVYSKEDKMPGFNPAVADKAYRWMTNPGNVRAVDVPMPKVENPTKDGMATKLDENDLPGREVAPPQAAPRLALGQIVNGYRYKGGNPNDRNSWEKVQ